MKEDEVVKEYDSQDSAIHHDDSLFLFNKVAHLLQRIGSQVEIIKSIKAVYQNLELKPIHNGKGFFQIKVERGIV